MLSISSLMSLCWSNIFLDPYKAERSTIIKPCKVIMESSIQQVMTVQNEKWLFCRYLPKWHNSFMYEWHYKNCSSNICRGAVPLSQMWHKFLSDKWRYLRCKSIMETCLIRQRSISFSRYPRPPIPVAITPPYGGQWPWMSRGVILSCQLHSFIWRRHMSHT